MSEARMEAPGGAIEAAETAHDVAQAADHSHEGHHHDPAAHGENLKFAMWLFLASEVILFTVLIANWLVFRINHPDVVHEVHEKAGILLVSLNTFLLLTSSWTMVMGLREIQLGNRSGLVRYIAITAVLGIIFVALQGVEYTLLSSEGITIYDNEFGMRFYAPTALHGAHVIAGAVWAIWVALRARAGVYDKNPIGVELFGLYWHFVDVVWIILFTVIYLV
ncbi:heme-copper oxidase subunit III [Anaerolineae bacterium CFX9]|jgi:heme/copper-type cytochrome/quinol oxidase subunit 3|nr:heme-copper oxidase subunit III [Anaerolineae bacterium CFX9]